MTDAYSVCYRDDKAVESGGLEPKRPSQTDHMTIDEDDTFSGFCHSDPGLAAAIRHEICRAIG